MSTANPFLMFEGTAEQAMELYASAFADAEITSLVRYAEDAGDAAGTVARGTFTVGGLEVVVHDSPIPHEFTFTPSASIFITFDSAEELDRAHDALVDGGESLMPIGDYGFSPRFAWVNDRFGVSWQLNLAPAPA